jgi:hypothetical protein
MWFGYALQVHIYEKLRLKQEHLLSDCSVHKTSQFFSISSVRQIPRKLALLLLKEARALGNLVAKVRDSYECSVF